MSTLTELVEGLAARCETISGLHCYPVWLPRPPLPSLCVGGPIRWTYDETFDAQWRPVFELQLTVSAADLYRAQQTLYTYLAPSGTRSLPAAIYGDPTLGGVANDTRVLGSSRPPTGVEIGGGHQLQAALEVEVTAV